MSNPFGSSTGAFGGGFGSNNNNNTGSSTPSAFGATNTTAGAPATGAFANLGNNNAGNTTGAAKPSIFGGGGGAFGSSNTGSSIFGSSSTPAASTEAPKTQSVFGGAGAFGQPPAAKPAEGTTPPATGFGAGFFKPQANAGASTTPTSAFGSAPASGGLFGSKPATTPQSATTPAAPSLFPSLNKPAGDNAAAAAPAAGGGLFGSKPATSTTTPTLGGGLFGAKPADQQPAPGTTTTAPAAGSNLFGAPKPADNAAKPATGGLNFFANPSATTAPKPADNATPAAPATTGTLGGGLFGAKPATTTASTPTPAAGGGLFGAGLPAKPAEKKDGAAPAAPSLFGGGGGLFGAKPAATATGEKKDEEKKDATTNPAASSTLGLSALGGSTAPNVAVAPPSTLRGKTIDEIVNKWTGELEVHVKDFNKFAGEVGAWDRALIENGNNLARLYNQVLAAEREQQDVDNALDHIEQQQKAISSTLEEYEKLSQDIFGGSERGNHAVSIRALDSGPADTERDKNYMLATDLQAQLDDLSGSLTQMIDSVNELSLPSSSNGNASEDPLSQIATILSTHLESLQWIDGAVREVDSNIAEAERRVERTSYANGRSGSLGASRGFGSTR